MPSKPMPPLPPPPPRPDPRLTPQSIHGNIPPLDRSELPLVPLEQRLVHKSRPRPMDTSTHSPGYILANSDSRRVNYGVWYFSWRHYAFFWIVIDIALTGVALYISFSSKF